jgi:hypothetical protein
MLVSEMTFARFRAKVKTLKSAWTSGANDAWTFASDAEGKTYWAPSAPRRQFAGQTAGAPGAGFLAAMSAAARP